MGGRGNKGDWDLKEEEAVIKAAEHYMGVLKKKFVPWTKVLAGDQHDGGTGVFKSNRKPDQLGKKWSRRLEQARRGTGRAAEDKIDKSHIGRILAVGRGKRGSGDAQRVDSSPDSKRQRAGKERLAWTEKESVALLRGVQKYGTGKWTRIREDPILGSEFKEDRSPDDLKSKWQAAPFATFRILNNT